MRELRVKNMWPMGRRSRDGCCFCYLFVAFVVMSMYFLFVHNDLNSAKLTGRGSVNVSSLSDEEICSKLWKLASETDRSTPNRMVSTTIRETTSEDNSNNTSWDKAPHFRCDNTHPRMYVSQRGPYYVIYNYVKAKREFGCMESVTLSAPGDYRFLDNVIPLVERWQGPISVALYAPGHDFYTTLKTIAYLRLCQTELIRDLVTFHLFFDLEHTPVAPNGSTILDAYEESYDCALPPPWLILNDEDMYKAQKGLLYPINVARNVAKLAAVTYFVFPSDIELYPTRNFVSLFLNFISKNLDLVEPDRRNVFVLPVFEILENQMVPENKTRLLAMLKNKTAIIFHQGVCTVCHRVVQSEKWVRSNETEGLGVFSVGKRIGRYMVWEPFFVCTQNEPLWDERMTWEGQNNKMVQAYTMCVMDYDFHVLDNAFLIHKPGVKKKKVQMVKFTNVVQKSSKLIGKISKELEQFYGAHPNCTTKYVSVLKKKPKPDAKKDKAKSEAAGKGAAKKT